MRRLVLPLALLVALSAAGCASAVDRRALTAKAKVDEARWSEAYRCAPEELARAEVYLDLAYRELDDGEAVRALILAAGAEAAALEAVARARPCAPATRPDDRDGDGVADAVDRCPDLPGPPAHWGCPDTDGDLVFDDIDRCRLEPEDRDGYRDDDGCPDLDNDGDGIVDAFDACPLVPGPVETRGCPDADGDWVADAEDRCPNEKGPRDSPAGPGCPVPGGAVAAAAPVSAPAPSAADDARVTIGPERLELAEKLAFRPFAGDLLPESHAILREVARLLKDQPSLKLRIEGHTSSHGNAQVNSWMARARAREVRAFLIREGVAAARLAAVGHGSSRPVAPNSTAEGRAKNERVELVITSR